MRTTQGEGSVAGSGGGIGGSIMWVVYEEGALWKEQGTHGREGESARRGLESEG